MKVGELLAFLVHNGLSWEARGVTAKVYREFKGKAMKQLQVRLRFVVVDEVVVVTSFITRQPSVQTSSWL